MVGELHPGWWALGGAAALGLALAARRRPAGWERAALLAPLLCWQLAFPCLLDDVSDVQLLARFLLVGIVSISNNFKLLALALDRGPLASRALSTSAFVTVLLLPASIKPAAAATRREAAPARTSQTARAIASLADGSEYLESALRVAVRFMRFSGRFLVLRYLAVGLLAFNATYRAVPAAALATTVPAPVRFAYFGGYATFIYLFMAAVFDAAALVLGVTMPSVAMEPPFSLPFLSTSVSNFWGRRWNLYIGGLLRALVYDPIVEGTAIKDSRAPKPRPSDMRRAAAVFATYLASGALHEFLLGYMHVPAHGLHLLFFVAQAPVCLAEGRILRGPRRTWWRQSVPHAVKTAYTLTVLLGLSPLFFGPLLVSRDGFDACDRRLLRGVGHVLLYLDPPLPKRWLPWSAGGPAAEVI